MLGAALEGEAFLAGIDERIAHGGQVQRPNVGMAWCLRLLAVVGWMTGKTLLGRGRLWSPGGLSPMPLFLNGTAPSFPLWALSWPASPPIPHPSLDVYASGQDRGHMDND